MTSTIRQLFSVLTLVWVASFAASALAHGTDQEQIQQALMTSFDKPNNPLTVAPVVVQGDYAVAGWIQGEKGGRALMQKSHDHWAISVCGGNGLTQTKVLETTGIPAAKAKLLANAVVAAESKLTPHQRHLFDSFEGMMEVGVDHASQVEHGAHAAHGAPAK